jgi:16S rRNA (cytidine1402-2'-O)-methyltransferase
LHEEIRRGLLSELVEHYSREEPRGEIVLMIDRTSLDTKTTSVRSVGQLVSEFEAQGLDHRAALKKAARELGLSRADAYRQLLAERAR